MLIFVLGADHGRLIYAPVTVGDGAVLHPFSAICLGALHEGAQILPMSRCLRECEMMPKTTWAGVPAFQHTYVEVLSCAEAKKLDPVGNQDFAIDIASAS